MEFRIAAREFRTAGTGGRTSGFNDQSPAPPFEVISGPATQGETASRHITVVISSFTNGAKVGQRFQPAWAKVKNGEQAQRGESVEEMKSDKNLASPACIRQVIQS